MIKFNKEYRNYWSSSKLAKYIRPIKKPYALTKESWGIYYDNYKKLYPIRFYITEELLDKLEDYFYFFNNCLYSINVYFSNRFVTKTHVLKSNLIVGQWHGYDNRLASCIFDSFTGWMETEYSSSSKPNPNKLIEKHTWESSLIYDEYMGAEKDNLLYGKKTRQAVMAIELFEIYQYCKYQRHNMIKANEKYLMSDDADYKVYNDKESAIEKLDTEHLIKIIENRGSMWT